MSLFGQKAPGLTLNTTAANSGSNPFGSTTSQAQPAGGLFGSAQPSQPQASGPFTSGGLGSTASSQPAASGGLFGNAASSQPQQSSGGLFGNAASSQPQQSGGLFGSTTNTTQPAPSGGLFANTGSSQPQQSGGLFGASANTSQPQQNQQTSSLFGASLNQPAPASQPQQSGFSLGGFGNQANATNPSASILGQSTNQTSSGVKIDQDHLRTTTRFEQLTDDIQKIIEKIDNNIVEQMTRSHEVADVLPVIAGSGANLPNDVTFVSDKLEELELGLENDASGIKDIRDKVVAKDAAEAKLCFRGVDRLKMPAQYQQQQLYHSVNGATAGGLSGWWNHPQTLQRSVRGASTAGGRRNLQLPGEDDEEAKGPSNLVDFFEKRTIEMGETLKGYKEIMHEIESHLGGVETMIATKQRELNDSRSAGGAVGRGSDEHVRELRYAFRNFEGSIYNVADQLGDARDGLQELVLGAVHAESKLKQNRTGW